jgi:hypothetical protein
MEIRKAHRTGSHRSVSVSDRPEEDTMRTQKMVLIALTVVAGLSLTACNGEEEAALADDPSATAAVTPGSDDAGGKEPGAAGSDSGDQSASDKCRTDGLEITAIDSTISGDETNSVAVTFRNSGGSDCTMAGFAGVDLETNSGTISAERAGDPADRITLKPGDHTSFGITYPVNDTGGSGVRITGLKVTPPGETKTASLEWPGAASLPVTEDGGGTPVQVHPLGSAGQGG